jgi:ubiquinone/menaquinone biosynthesis C-methylase UbiE
MSSPAKMQAPGTIFRWPKTYDWLLRLVWGSSEPEYRAFVVDLASVARGHSVLDVGCGTGTLAIAARDTVGPTGTVVAVDASREMIERARRKSSERGLNIEFAEAPAQKLPFADSNFDRVLSTTVIHCLPTEGRAQSYSEMARVLKPEGQLLLVDFGGSTKRSLFGHMNVHRRFNLADEMMAVKAAGLAEISSGPLGFSDLHYILATKKAD